MAEDDFLTTAQAAAFLGLNRQKLRRLAAKRGIAAHRSPYDDRVVLYRRADLEPLKEAARPTPTAEGERRGRAYV